MWTALRHLLHIPDPPCHPPLPLAGTAEIDAFKGRARQAAAKLDARTRQIERQAVVNIASAEANTDAISKLVEAMSNRAEGK